MEKALEPALLIDVLDDLSQGVVAVAIDAVLAIVALRQLTGGVVRVLGMEQPLARTPHTLSGQPAFDVVLEVPLQHVHQRFLEHLPGGIALNHDRQVSVENNPAGVNSRASMPDGAPRP
ncbi:hypothetical protein OOT46_27560 [Aquabacterium sp. A7-Y]|uniref:hypothetical protein n=1 Tax=Aquabacterium sp. A7-Y TaxID=1349605 RepID=UPI00223D5EAC|nr:hypothetical protein [Aquabacterium sp. A7-Y]MCW7541567.1 hypothetical protein [Aquabacterium sp. A7-Y]